MNEYRFSLEQTVKYSDKGEFLDADFITFNHWTGKHSQYYYEYVQMIGGLFSNQKDGQNGANENKSDDDNQEDVSDDDLIEMLHMIILSSEGMNAFSFVEVFKKMVCHKGFPLALLNGDQPMKNSHFDELTPDDKLRAAVGYAVFFGAGLFKNRKNT